MPAIADDRDAAQMDVAFGAEPLPDLQALDDDALIRITGRGATSTTADTNNTLAVILWDEPGQGGDKSQHTTAVGIGNEQTNHLSTGIR